MENLKPTRNAEQKSSPLTVTPEAIVAAVHAASAMGRVSLTVLDQSGAERPTNVAELFARGILAAATRSPAGAGVTNPNVALDDTIDFADARQFLDSWGCLVHPIPQILELAERAAQAAPPPTRQYIPKNFATHRTAWRDAITECINVEIAKGNADQASYWEHELAAYDRSFARLLDAPEPERSAG